MASRMHTIVPVFVGSATQVAGMAQLLDGILDSFPSTARKTETRHRPVDRQNNRT